MGGAATSLIRAVLPVSCPRGHVAADSSRCRGVVTFAAVDEVDRSGVVGGFQHISVHPYSVFIENVKNKAVIDDWQLSFLVSQDFKYMTPYTGMYWSRMDYIHWTEDDRNRVKSDLNKSVGLIAGMDVPVRENIWLNVEGQFVSVQAVAASINFHF